MPSIAADGSSLRDGPGRIEIDLEDARDRWRYLCPRGHTTWERTNSHGWCQSCARNANLGGDVDPNFYEVLDAKTGETIPWSAIAFR